jgi:phosphoglycerate dehydrogenase-like enzyme
VFVIATVIDDAADAACQLATRRTGLLGLGNVGSAFARLTREAADHLFRCGLALAEEADA